MFDSGSDGHAQSEYYVVMVGLAPDFRRLVSGIQICLPAEMLKFVSELRAVVNVFGYPYLAVLKRDYQ